MIEFAAMAIGYSAMIAGGLGLVCVVAWWSVERVLEFTKLNRIIIQWYGEKLKKERSERATGA